MSDAPTPATPLSPAGEFRKKFWDDGLKSWLDVRQYLRQRAEVLRHPDLNFPPEVTGSPEWQSPLKFALQGTAVVAIFTGLLGAFFDTFVAQRPATVFHVQMTDKEARIHPMSVPEGQGWSAKQKRIEANLATLHEELKGIRAALPTAAFPHPVPYSATDTPTLFLLQTALAMRSVNRDEAIKAYEQEIATLEKQLFQARLAPHVETAHKNLNTILWAAGFVLAAYIFRWLSRQRVSHRGPSLEHTHIHYLYSVTAALFWVHLSWSLLFALRRAVASYFPQPFHAMVDDLDHTLRTIDGEPMPTSVGETLFTVGAVIIAIWAYIRLRKLSIRMRDALGLAAPDEWWQLYVGHRKIQADVVIANVLSLAAIFALFSIAALLYAALKVATETLKI